MALMNVELIHKFGGDNVVPDALCRQEEFQRMSTTLRKGKVLKEFKLVDGLLKYKQCRVYVPQDKLKLLV